MVTLKEFQDEDKTSKEVSNGNDVCFRWSDVNDGYQSCSSAHFIPAIESSS